MKKELQEKLQKKLQQIESTVQNRLKEAESPEEQKKFEDLKDRVQRSRKLIWDNPRVIGDEHEFTENPYSETVGKESLEKLEKQLENVDLQSLEEESARKKLENTLKDFEEKRKK